MEKNDYDKKRYTQMKILKQDMEIMKKEIEQLKDALKQKVEIPNRSASPMKLEVSPKMETLEIPKLIETPKMEIIETPVETLETPKVERHLQYGIPVKIDEMENLPGSSVKRLIQYIDSYPTTNFTRHQTHRNSRTMKKWK